MSDPIDKLTRLGDALEGAPMPLPASAIRARGDRIRRRKHAAVAGASAAVVAAVAVPVIVLGGGDSGKEIPPADPSVSDPVPPSRSAALGQHNLLTSEQAVYPNGGADWRESTTFEGDGQGTASPCQQSSFEVIGADSVLQRDFEFVVTDSGEVEPSLHFNEVVAEFPSTRDAQAAYDEIRGWYDDCIPPGAESYTPGEFSDVPIGRVGLVGAAEVQVSRYGPVDEALDPFGDEGWFLETGLVLLDDRIAVLTQLVHGQDYNWPEGTPVFQMVPDAAQQLAIGNEVAPPTDPTDPPAADGLVTDIPDGFPLTDGWPADDGSDEYQLDAPSADNQAMVDGSDLDGCGQPAERVAPADRLTTRLNLGSAYYARELQLFSDEAEAERYFDSIQDAFAVCEAEGGAGYSVEQSGESVALLWSESIYRSVTIAVRARNAVLVGIESDEGGSDVATVDRMWVGVAEGQAGVRAELQELLDGAPGTSPGGADTTIPDDFPLDVDLDDPGADGELHPPYRPAASEEGVEVDLCGNVVWPPSRDGGPAYADLLRARATGPEWGDYRELTTYASVDAAVAAVADIRSALEGCERDGSWVWTVSDVDTGYDSVTFHRTYTQGLGHDAFQVTRVGTAVLFTVSTGEGSIADLGPAAQERTRLTRTIAPSMCLFTEDGCR